MEKTRIHRGNDSWMQNCVHLGSTSIYAANFRANSEMTWHSHDVPSFHFVLHGATTEQDEREVADYDQGSTWFRAPGEPHLNTFTNRGAVILAFFLGDRFAAVADDLAAMLRYKALPGVRSLSLGARIREELAFPDSCTPIAVEGLMLELVAELIRGSVGPSSTRRPPAWLSHVRHLVDASPITEAPAIRGLADAVERDPAYVARAFRRYYGLGIGDYFRRRRIRAVERLLISDKANLGQIAAQYGFFDQSHLNRHFKRFNGVTPTQYRSALRPESNGESV